MPKELTHWLIARRVARSSPAALKDLLERNIHLFLLGAVIHDSPFYLRKSDGGALVAASLRAHGLEGEDTYEPLRRLRDGLGPVLDEGTAAFLCGAACHLASDAVFHPYIYYMCGWDPKRASPAAAERHNQLEVLLDLFYLRGESLPNGGRYAVSLRLKETKDADFLRLVSAFYPPGEGGDSATLREMLKRHAIIQGLFFNRWMRLLVSLARPLPGMPLAQYRALFYPCWGRVPAKLESPQRYLHPVTGEEMEETLPALLDRAVAAAADLVRSCMPRDPAPDGPWRVPNGRGPSLVTGLPGAPGDRMIHFGEWARRFRQ